MTMQASPLDFKGELFWTAEPVVITSSNQRLLISDPYRVYVFFANNGTSGLLIQPVRIPILNSGIPLDSSNGRLAFHFRDVGPLVGEEWWSYAGVGYGQVYVATASFRPIVESCD